MTNSHVDASLWESHPSIRTSFATTNGGCLLVKPIVFISVGDLLEYEETPNFRIAHRFRGG